MVSKLGWNNLQTSIIMYGMAIFLMFLLGKLIFVCISTTYCCILVVLVAWPSQKFTWCFFIMSFLFIQSIFNNTLCILFLFVESLKNSAASRDDQRPKSIRNSIKVNKIRQFEMKNWEEFFYQLYLKYIARAFILKILSKEIKLQNSKMKERKKRCRTTLLKLDMCPLCKHEHTYSSYTPLPNGRARALQKKNEMPDENIL